MFEMSNDLSNKSSGRLETLKRESLPGFVYRNGFLLSATDLGNNGVKFEFSHENDVAAAIILPPEAVAQCGRWLLKTLGQDRHGLPEEFQKVLRRLSKHKGIERSLERGDKKHIKDALRALRAS